MTQDLKEKIARNAASGWCRCFKCDGVFDDTNIKCDKEKLVTCQQWYNGYRAALLALDDDRIFENLWKPADGEDLPEIDKEVIALIQPCSNDEHLRVVFAHRPNKYTTWIERFGEEKIVEVERYGKGEWNIPNVKWWLDCELPKMEE